MKKYLHMIKPWDYIIIIFLILISFLPLAIFTYQQLKQNAATENPVLTAYVKHDGQVVYKIRLTDHQGIKTFTYKEKDGDYNVIKVTDEQIQISDANCSDQVCVRRGKISKAGDTIVCLPHKLLVEIKSTAGTQDGGLVTE